MLQATISGATLGLPQRCARVAPLRQLSTGLAGIRWPKSPSQGRAVGERERGEERKGGWRSCSLASTTRLRRRLLRNPGQDGARPTPFSRSPRFPPPYSGRAGGPCRFSTARKPCCDVPALRFPLGGANKAQVKCPPCCQTSICSPCSRRVISMPPVGAR